MQRVERRMQRKNHFLFINSYSDDCASPSSSPPPVYSPLKASLDRATTAGMRGCNSSSSRSSIEVLFQVISLQHVIILLRVLLLERSVLFLSSQYSLLTTVMEALKELLYIFLC